MTLWIHLVSLTFTQSSADPQSAVLPRPRGHSATPVSIACLRMPASSCSSSSFSLVGLSCSWWSVLSTWAPASYLHVPGGQLQPLQLPLASLPSGSSRYVGVRAGAVKIRRASMEHLLDPPPTLWPLLLLQGWPGRIWGVEGGSFPSQSCPSGAGPSGLCVDSLCPSESQRHPPGAVCPHPGTVVLAASPKYVFS